MAKLVVVTKGLADLSHELTGSWTTIGRDEASAFQIVESSVSGSHCEVQLRGQELAVRDLDSTNGTFVHGLKIIEAFLEPGQTLRVGDVDVLFEAAVVPEVPFVNTMLLKGAGRGTEMTTTAAPQMSTGPAKKYQVLLVDDSNEFIEVFGKMCSALANETWEIHFATSADRALVSLQHHPIDLAVLDIGMPLVDGLQLLGIIRRRYPDVKLAVMTSLATESNRAAGLANGGGTLY
jgi:CheY-like chemotaxis protein